ncbi:hypothetical protein GGF44_003134, partial [Coemansia sp. RSA 1694]
DEDEEIAAATTTAAVDPVPAPEEVGEGGEEEHVPLSSAAGEKDTVIGDNVDQGTDSPPPADNADNLDIVADSVDNAVEAAAAAVEKVAAATYSAHAIGDVMAAMDSPSAAREDMSVDGDNSAPATPSEVGPSHVASPVSESLPPVISDNGAVDTASDNQSFA